MVSNIQSLRFYRRRVDVSATYGTLTVRSFSRGLGLVTLSFLLSASLANGVSAQTVDLNLQQLTRQPGDLGQTEQKRVQALYESAIAKRKAGLLPQALIDAEAALLITPRDLPLRFLRAVLLNQQNQYEAALSAFEQLTQDYPELAEPHNNAAVLYAQKGEIDKARVFLLRALSIFPSYAVAQENLGDVYLRMAQQAYAAAGKADGKSVSVAAKLKLTTEWLSNQGIAISAK